MTSSFRSAMLGVVLVVTACHDNSSATGPRSADEPAGCDPSRAYAHVKKMVDLGPRPSGSPAIIRAQEYISNELKSYGLKVIEDAFNGDTPRGSIPMKNLIGELAGNKAEIVMISGHYDTKVLAGFVGANDGGSSTAAVLELARVLSKKKPEYTLWFVFFDGEEAVVDWNANNGLDNTYGSRHLAAKLTDDGTLQKVKSMLLVDMIGDKNLDIEKDGYSTPWLTSLIWETARQMGFGRHFIHGQTAISDDHLPFAERGVPVIDIIDFNYGPNHSYWHTSQDTLDKVSGESIKVVCDVIVAALPEIYKRLNEPNPSPARRKIE